MASILEFLKKLFDPRDFLDPFRDRRLIPMKEDRIPVDKSGRPDLAGYTEPASYYQEMYDTFLASSTRRLTPRESNLAFRQRVHAMYGLIARGRDSLSYALRMLGGSNPDAREDGATILKEIGGAPTAVDALLAAFDAESDDVARTAIIEALGNTRSPRAREALRQLLARSDLDGDTREAVERSVARLR